MKYRKKPVVIEAVQYLREENIGAIQDFIDDGSLFYGPEDNEYYIRTLEGDHRCTKYDYIIKGVAGEFYPCKPDIFEMTYEPVAISKAETTGCHYCIGIESHGIVAVKTVIDEYLRVIPAYDTPYNYCPNCGRKIKEQTGGTERKQREE